MRVDLFDFDLPEDNIALRPASPRDSARLLVVQPQDASELSDRSVMDLPSFLRPGDALVFNDTKVIPAQLEGLRRRGADVVTEVSLTLHMRVAADRWKAFARPAKRLKPGDRIEFGHGSNTCLMGALDATVAEKGEAGEVTLQFDLSGPALDDAILAVGHIPLPPYIASKRAEDEQDRTDYQTVYARERGAVAAPTAGLHFTDRLFNALDALGVERHFVTLHVGAGTFLPMKVDDTDDHVMHQEIGHVSAEVAERLNAVRARGGRIVCVGTTSLRLIESAARREWRYPPLVRPDRHLHHARLSLSRGGYADDQFSPAEIDFVHAGFCVQWPGHHAARLCPRDRNRLPILFLRRFQPAFSGIIPGSRHHDRDIPVQHSGN